MSKAHFIKELEPTVVGQRICLIELDEKFYAVSSISCAPDHGGPETLVFRAHQNGEITDWADVAGGRNLSREETIAQLEERGEAEYESETSDLLSAAMVVMNPPDRSYYTKKGRRK